jgi:hypothetical protein
MHYNNASPIDTSEVIEVEGGLIFHKSQTRRVIKMMEKKEQPCLTHLCVIIIIIIIIIIINMLQFQETKM